MLAHRQRALLLISLHDRTRQRRGSRERVPERWSFNESQRLSLRREREGGADGLVVRAAQLQQALDGARQLGVVRDDGRVLSFARRAGWCEREKLLTKRLHVLPVLLDVGADHDEQLLAGRPVERPAFFRREAERQALER